VITFSKSGCNNQMASVYPTLAGSGVILGGLIDYGTGAVYNLTPNPVVVSLNCSAIATDQPSPTATNPNLAERRVAQ
jgi:hypothetical protein